MQLIVSSLSVISSMFPYIIYCVMLLYNALSDQVLCKGAFHLVRTHLAGVEVGVGVKPHICIAYHMQKGGGRGKGVQKACKIAYILNGRPQTDLTN